MGNEVIIKEITVICDKCGKDAFRIAKTITKARKNLQKIGWKYNPVSKIDLCYDCAKTISARTGKSNIKSSKKVYVYNLITNEQEVYPSIRNASLKMNVSRQCLNSAINRRSKVQKMYWISHKPFAVLDEQTP